MNYCLFRSSRRMGPKKNLIVELILFFLLFGGSISFGQFQPGSLPEMPERDHVRISLVPQFVQVGPGERMAVAVVLDIDEGWHLYGNPKGESSLGMATEIRPVAVEDVRFGRPIYPAGKSKLDPFSDSGETYFSFEGRVVCFLPVEVGESVSGSVNLQLELSGLLCSDRTCIPWKPQVHVGLWVAGMGKGVEMQPELFAGVDLKKAWEDEVAVNSPVIAAQADVVVLDYRPRELEGDGLDSGQWLKPLLLALVAGMILNLMPCVLPVIPIKVLQLIQQGQQGVASGDKYKSVKLSLVFSLGILLVFISLAVMMSSFKLLYGQQFQSQTFKFVMLMIIYLLSLSMMGLFEVSLPSKLSNIQVVQKGYLGAFGMGVLATLLATPCSAPLLGPVLTWSLSKPTPIVVMVFTVIGIGMAAPYVLLTAFPGLMNKIPKAGNWMIRLKEGLGFVMLAVAVYLVFLFPAQWQFPLMVFCVMLALGLWLAMKVVSPASSPMRRFWARLSGLAVIVLGAVFVFQSTTQEKLSGQEVFGLAALEQLHEQKKNVMVEFTADWCPNCKYVEKTVLHTDAFQKSLSDNDVTLMIADMTHFPPEVTTLLEKLGSKSIPFTAVFPAKTPLEPIVLRDIYTLDTILTVLDSVD
jgi:thiol:disulfide interchange protein